MTEVDLTDPNLPVLIGKVVTDIIDDATGEVIRRRVQHHFPPGNGRTSQEYKETVNINSIVARMKAGQMPDQVNTVAGLQADYSRGQDYTEAANRIAEANESFMDLPGKVRAIAHNDPGKFLEMLGDPAGATRLLEAGLDPSVILPQAPPAPAPATPAAPAPADPAPADPPP